MSNTDGRVPLKHERHQRVGNTSDVQGIGQQDRRFHLSEFGDLHQADGFAETIEDGRSRPDLGTGARSVIESVSLA